MNSAIPLSVVLPCYNAANGWKEIVLTNLSLIAKHAANTELIIINDGSTKNFTEEEVKNFFSGYPAVKIISYDRNRGKGYALREGVKNAQGEKIIYTDIDFPYTHDSFLKIYTALQSPGTDIAIGIRGEEYYTHLSAARARISKLLRFFIKKFLRIPTDDTQCGLKGFSQKGKEVFLQTTIDRYLFDLEFIFLAAKNKLSIKTIIAELRPEVQLSEMSSKILLVEFRNFIAILMRSII